MNSSASACSRDSARSMACRVSGDAVSPSAVCQNGERFAPPGMRWAMDQARSSRRFHALGRGPGVADIGKAVGAGGLPQRHAEQIERLKIEVRARAAENRVARAAPTMNSSGVRILLGSAAQARSSDDERRRDDVEIAVAVAEFLRQRVDEIGRQDRRRRNGARASSRCGARSPDGGRDRRAPPVPARRPASRVGLAEDRARARLVPIGLEERTRRARRLSLPAPRRSSRSATRANSVTSACV